MRYARAQGLIPDELLHELQKYIDGAYLYIPRKQENRLSWGDQTHSKQETAARNTEIFSAYEAGCTVAELAQRYFLTEKTIRRIISQLKRK